MTILIRGLIKDAYDKAQKSTQNGNIHAGLLLNKGYLEDSDEGDAKTTFIQSVCKAKADTFYSNAYSRWQKLTDQSARFMQVTMTLENRLLIGLSGTGALETGCAISHTYGMPYIPGSSIKGTVRNWARQNLPNLKEQWTELFGSAPDTDDQNSFSGLVTFHDAWWVPGSSPVANGGPFTQEIVTTHHKAYYETSGETEASDLDSPVPNALVGVHGKFLFVLEGHSQEHLNIAATMLGKALSLNGIGAKTSSGYGYFQEPSKAVARTSTEGTGKLEKVSGQYRVVLDDVGKTGVISGDFFEVFKAAHLASNSAKTKLKRGLKVKVSYIENGNQKDVVSIALLNGD